MSLTSNDKLRNRSDYPGDDGINHLELFNKMQEEIESLRVKLAEAEQREAVALKDAERYRWLRNKQSELFGDEYGFTFVYEPKFDDFKQLSRGLDEAIDAAIAKGEE